MAPLLASACWAPIVQTVVVAISAIGGGAFGAAFGQWFTWQKERQAVAAALPAEVRGFIDVMDWRQTRELIPLGYKFAIEDHSFPIFEANVGKIGFLPADLAGKVTGFYSYAAGIAQDFRTLQNEDPSKWALGQDRKFRERLVHSIDTIKTKAEVLIPELKKEAARTWQDYLQP